MNQNNLYDTINSINDINALMEMKNRFISLCESREKYLQAIKESNEINSESFLYIKESFANLSESLFKTSNGRRLIKQYINEHKSNKNLQKMFLVYENICSANKNLNVDLMLNEMKEMVGTIDSNSLKEGVKKLVELLREAYVEVGVEAKDMLSKHNNIVLDESVKYVFDNTKKLDNLSSYITCMNEIKSFINNNEVKPLVFEKKINIDNILDEFNSTFSKDTMGEEAFNLVREINESENKAELFENYKNDCLNALTEAININEDQATCDRLYEFKTKITRKEYNPDTIGMDIANFIDFKNMVLN